MPIEILILLAVLVVVLFLGVYRFLAGSPGPAEIDEEEAIQAEKHPMTEIQAEHLETPEQLKEAEHGSSDPQDYLDSFNGSSSE